MNFKISDIDKKIEFLYYFRFNMKELNVNIDFDEASKLWRANKKTNKSMIFCDTCNYIHTKNNKKCNSIVYNTNYVRYYKTAIEETVKYHRNCNRYCKKHLNCETWKIKN